MASRTLRDTGTAFDGRIVDIGASYFTASEPEFAEVVARLESDGVLRQWTSGFHIAGPTGLEGISGGPMRYAAPAGLRSVVEALAANLSNVELETEVGRVDIAGDGVLVDGVAADAVALCMPTPQAARVTDHLVESRPLWEPVLAVTCVFDRSYWLEFDGVFVNDDPILSWIADDGARRGDGAPVLVAHVSPLLSARHLDDPVSVIGMALAAVQRVLGFSAHPDWVDVHRWTFAKPLSSSAESFWIADEWNLAVAGDAFASGPKVEAAWLSGHRLGSELAGRLR